MNNLINIVKKSIDDAEQEISKLTQPILELVGMSSPKVRHFLNNVIYSNSRYLEIGCWRGSTFISAMWKNNPSIAFVIDNWNEFNNQDGGGLVSLVPYEHSKQVFYNNIDNFIESQNIKIIEDDCFNIDIKKNKICDINIYFYDGEHSYDSQYNAISHYYNALANEFILIIDDWNMTNTKLATMEVIKDLNLTILFEQVMPADFNGDLKRWWNGLYISVLKKHREQ